VFIVVIFEKKFAPKLTNKKKSIESTLLGRFYDKKKWKIIESTQKGRSRHKRVNTLDPDFIFKPNEHDGIYHVKICKSDTVGCYGPPQ
jgi:hypothetical protein